MNLCNSFTFTEYQEMLCLKVMFLCFQPEENVNTTERVFIDRQYQVSTYTIPCVIQIFSSMPKNLHP
jgi:hypothetical protein